MIGADPYAVLETLEPDTWPEDFDPYEAALRQFIPDDPAPLLRLLNSDNDWVTRRGLYLFSELGRKSFPVLDDAICHIDHPDSMARCYVLSGLLSLTQRLSSGHVRQVLTVEDLEHQVDPPSGLVRSKAITLLGALNKDTVRRAVSEILYEEMRARHQYALDNAPTRFDDIQKVFDIACSQNGIEQVYAFAALESAARRDLIKVAPECEGCDDTCDWVVWQMKRHIHRNFQRNDPAGWQEGYLEHRKKPIGRRPW